MKNLRKSLDQEAVAIAVVAVAIVDPTVPCNFATVLMSFEVSPGGSSARTSMAPWTSKCGLEAGILERTSSEINLLLGKLAEISRRLSRQCPQLGKSAAHCDPPALVWIRAFPWVSLWFRGARPDPGAPRACGFRSVCEDLCIL